MAKWSKAWYHGNQKKKEEDEKQKADRPNRISRKRDRRERFYKTREAIRAAKQKRKEKVQKEISEVIGQAKVV